MPNGYDQAQVEALCQQWKNKIGLEFLIYDYMKYDNTDSAFESFNKLGAMCDFLKNRISGNMDIAVLAAAQLNRNDLVSGSDKLECYCSTSVRWFEKSSDQIQKDGIDCGNYGASVMLNRNGATTGEDGYIDILFKGSVMQITSAQQHKHSDLPFD